ncbi:hypothetical protein TNCT_312351 [Trichonephila clavata]|uniref:Uncharacterized protein n=1 Tax=Trichonephila clavata TaxID=2740835 RepID=A0A8X6HQ79_TRICU|nr:hypothetical protein TNCT_312351 [Trichonephila clavata]
MQWKHLDSSKPKKFKAQQSAGKVILSVFLDIQGLLLLEFKEQDVSINDQRYTQTLDKLYKTIKNKHPVSSFCKTMQGHVSPRYVSRHWPVKSGKSWIIQLTAQIYHLAIFGLSEEKPNESTILHRR